MSMPACKSTPIPLNFCSLHLAACAKAEATLRLIYMLSPNYRVSTKSKAPSPPGLKKLDSPGFSQWYPGNPHLTMDQKENLIDKDLSLVVILPGGEEKMTTVHGRYSSDHCV